MTLRTLRKKLREVLKRNQEDTSDKEREHDDADELLLEYIGDKTVSEIWAQLDIWYA